MTHEITILIDRLPSGRYGVHIATANGPVVVDGATVEGVIRAASLAIVDVLDECVDVSTLDRWEDAP